MSDHAQNLSEAKQGPVSPDGPVGALTQNHNEQDPASRRPGAPVSTVRWHESWIVRAMMFSSVILVIGYVASAFFAFKSIESMARLAHDPEVEAVLGTHLENLKVVHGLQQQLALERLQPQVARLQAAGSSSIPEKKLRAMLKDAGLSAIADLDKVEIHSLNDPPDGPAVAWVSRDRLRILDRELELPRGPVFEAFREAEEIRKRYQIIGVRLEEIIQPTLVRATSVTLGVSFLLLASIFIIYARKFHRRIHDMTEGFSHWSEQDSQFRFDDNYRGELRVITSQFNAMADEVETNRQRSLYLEKIASWQIIARKLAHEIKNPLTPIQMMVGQLKRRYKGGDEEFAKLLDEAHNIIGEEVAGLRRMVDNFSNFARLPEARPRMADLVPVLKHVVSLQKNAFPDHEIAFESAFATAIAPIDEDLIRQLLINLIKNAGEACTPPARITVLLDQRGSDWLVMVRDNGPGIPPDTIGRIFEAYFTTKHTGPTPGMGLGLAVCQKIVMDHGGQLTVKSRPGETIFTIRLPRRSDSKDGQA